MDWIEKIIANIIPNIVYNYQIIDVTIKGLALLLGFSSAVYGYWTIQNSRRNSDYQQLMDFATYYTDPEFLKLRNIVVNLWYDSEAFVIGANKNTKNINVFHLHGMKSEEEIKDYLKEKADIKFKDDITDEFVRQNVFLIKSTITVLNRYENIGKLLKLKAIRKDTIDAFFYTTIADTFVACLPYIFYRRKSKETYAEKMQKIIKYSPNLSGNIREL